MVIVAAILIGLLILFGVLALPYSVALAGVSWGIALLVLLLAWVRIRERRKSLVIGVLVVCVVGVAAWTLLLMPWANQEVVSDVQVFNANTGGKRAFVVYHPGRSDLQARATTGFIEGLTLRGWQVDFTTASSQTPTDLSNYQLLVLGAQSYTWAPAQPIQDYVRRVGDLKSLSVVAILSGLGETEPANAVMRDLIANHGGNLVQIYNVWQVRPIDEMYGTDDPFIAMREVAQSLMVP